MPGRDPASEQEIRQVRNRIAQNVQGGGIGGHLLDIQSLNPAIAGVDFLEFRAKVTGAGVITQPDRVTTPAGFMAELYAISGWMQDPGTDPELAALIAFSVEDMGRAGVLFSSDLYMAGFVNPEGGQVIHPIPRGLYVFDPTTPVKVKFSIDGDSSDGYATNASAVKHWGVRLHLNLFAVR